MLLKVWILLIKYQKNPLVQEGRFTQDVPIENIEIKKIIIQD
jgi:hypothetical protein